MKRFPRKVCIYLGTFACLLLGPFAWSDAEWIVPATSRALRIEVEGTVEISRASVQTIRTGSPDAVVSWMGPDGRHAAFGEELMRLDTSGLQREHQGLLDELTVLKQQSSNQIYGMEKALAQEVEAVAELMADLDAKSATAREKAAPDPSRIATLEREIELIQREAVLQEADLRRLKNLYELGELARIEVEDAELRMAATLRSIRVAELALEEAGDGSDPVLARRAAWQVERARISIGVDASGELRDDQGYGKKLAAVRHKVERRRKSLLQSIAAHEVEVQGMARAAWAHLPLQELRISNADGVVKRLNASDAQAAAGYDSVRGMGWVTPPITAPSKNALLIRGVARWRCDLAPGDYRLAFVLGDAVEWNCMSVKHAGRPLVAVNRLEPNQTETYEADVQVGKDGLVLDIGLEQKAVIASSAGAVKYQTWLGLGRSIRNNPPALYLTPSARLNIRLRVHHLQVPFFEQSEAAVRHLELRNSAGDWIRGGPVKITDDPVGFFVEDDSNQLQADDRPEERTAREITVAVPPEHSDGFAFAAHVACRAVAEPAVDTVALPAFLVHQGEDGLFVQRGGAPVQVRGSRYDQHFLITEGVSPGDRLSLPTAIKSENGAHRITGEVVAGSAVPMTVPTRSWARIESLLPHGSRVAKGDLVITMYRPQENEKAVRAEAKAVAAETRFLEAVDDQQAAFLRETAAHAQAVEEEKLAADRVSENRRLERDVLAGAEEAERAAKDELALLNKRVAALAGKESTRLAYEDYRRRRDVLELQSKSRKLDAIAAFRRESYPDLLRDRVKWLQSREELALRESKLALNLEQEEVLSQRAKSMLENNLEDRSVGRDFETMRFLRAPADGHVFYLKGYNDLAKRNERIDKEFIVWNGLTVAEILDMGNLSFRISLPESHYYTIRTGMELPIELEDLGDRILVGTVATKGRSLYVPKANGRRDQQAVSLNRVFDVTLSFSAPEDLYDLLRPGLRGAVTLP